MFQVVVRRFQERSEDKMSVVDDVIAADRTEQVSGGEGIETGLLSRHTQVHSSTSDALEYVIHSPSSTWHLHIVGGTLVQVVMNSS